MGEPLLLRPVDKELALEADDAPAELETLPWEWVVPGFDAQMLVPDAARALITLLEDARAAGHELRVRSSYRSYAEQERTFQFWVDELGLEQAERESARPGHSEHQLGSTADLASATLGWELIPEFGDTPEGGWLAEHVYEYGFALSYPPNSEDITGYIWEPWHVRYVGQACAQAWHDSGLTLIEILRETDGRAS